MRVLIVDDERQILEQMAIYLSGCGFEVDTASSGAAALEQLAARQSHVALIDYRMPGMDGVELAKKLLEEFPETTVLMMTAHGSVDTAVEAMKLGVQDFLLKPLRIEQLRAKLRLIEEKLRAEDEVAGLRRMVRERYRFDQMVGQSTAMQRVFAQLEEAARSDLPVLIVGETGTGKELAAQAVHVNGSRRDAPFVAVNCGAVAEGLVESELFGHVKGAFTGADQHRAGKIAAADGGTLLLDELASAPPGFQIKLLRVLETKQYAPVGSDTTKVVSLRVIAAMNESPEAALAAGSLRSDLFYRLNVLRIDLPPLRERAEDIPLLVHHFMARSRRFEGQTAPAVDPALLDELMTWPWPGNVRQLQNVIVAALTTASGTLTLDNIPVRLRPHPHHVRRATPVGKVADEHDRSPGLAPLEDYLRVAERQHIEAALRETGGHMRNTADLLGVTERGLRRKIARLGIARVDFVRRQ